MSELNPDMFDDLKETATKGERRERLRLGKRKKPGPTGSDKQKRALEIRAAREARVRQARDKIQTKLLERHFSSETGEQERLQRYIKWVEDSLVEGYPFMEDKDIEFKGTIASVKAGGQHRQRKRTAVRAIHLPTTFFVKNEEERSFEQNKIHAREALYRNLEEHFKLWQVMIKNSAAPVNVGQTTQSMVKGSESR